MYLVLGLVIINDRLRYPILMSYNWPCQDLGMQDACEQIEMRFKVASTFIPFFFFFPPRSLSEKSRERAATRTPALAVDRKCFAACSHIIPACTALARSLLCVLSPREMEGRGKTAEECEAMFASEERSRSSFFFYRFSALTFHWE